MRKLAAIVALLLGFAIVSHVWARGGEAADDCPPGSKDPDCVNASGAKH